MTPFAGFSLPVSYAAGTLAEHTAARTAAALFDVSHMGQIRVSGDAAGSALESLLPADLLALPMHAQRYSFLLNDAGGILDDLMVIRRHDDWLLIVNAATTAADLAILGDALGSRCDIELLHTRALLALQGPRAAEALGRLNSDVTSLPFMTGCTATLAGCECYVTRSGYTGEDGFEISCPAAEVERLAATLAGIEFVSLAGLGARDTLRLEAGLCLMGTDLNDTITPVEANLAWAIAPVRRPGGARAGGYPGAGHIADQLQHGPARSRLGLLGTGRLPARASAALIDEAGANIGIVSSGNYSPTLGRPVAMAYVAQAHRQRTRFVALVRSERLEMTATPMPFVPHRYFRGTATR
jgi:aminomethyltransferase